jgi:hypothetical protein
VLKYAFTPRTRPRTWKHSVRAARRLVRVAATGDPGSCDPTQLEQ